ncbi:arylamine N-acetyltransferase [Nocardiopsis sp. ATB16-24]|uniref:arylamine N-acetyltransferase n=1 Tax=Nocardiopsis sp. ATB16-24 TaxID=3019555 RepID=UPI002555E383|nr:arylamine N-acetyltransferase [Nocardiopsis sp. ATB16-24]
MSRTPCRRAVLDGLGFAVTGLGARVHAGGTEGPRPSTHALLRVDLHEADRAVIATRVRGVLCV